MNAAVTGPSVALACGGTGGHLFPGLAVAHELVGRGAQVTLFVSPKDVDQQGIRTAAGLFQVVTLPLVAFSGWRALQFVRATYRGYLVARRHFAKDCPAAVLAMGGFMSAVPIWAGRQVGALTFLHESNLVPGRANRGLARWVDEALVGFAEAAAGLRNCPVSVTGTPVRAEIRHADSARACGELGLEFGRPILLVTGGSQGAHGVNRLMLAALTEVAREHPALQFIHLTGTADFEAVDSAYRRAGIPAIIRPFSHQMDQMLAAATVVVSRSGASSLAEFAARRLPAVLVPYPAAADDHQRHNAAAFVRARAARMLDQSTTDGAALAAELHVLIRDAAVRAEMTAALAHLDTPTAAADIADRIWRRVIARSVTKGTNPARSSSESPSVLPVRLA